MELKQPNCCPVCKNNLNVSKMHCPHCKTEISGSFSPCKYCILDNKLSEFLEVFLKCRGNIKEIEKELNISYPTVKNLIDELLITLKLNAADESDKNIYSKSDILDMIEKGEITVKKGAEMLRALKN